MTTDLDVANRALGYIGLEAINAIDDASPSAAAVKSQWDICFASFLAEYEWSFAKQAVKPARLALEPPTWRYAFSLPDDFIRKIAVTLPDAGRYPGRRTPHRPEVPHEIMRVKKERHPVLCANVDDIVLEYVSSRTILGDFTPSAIETLEYLLAAKLCLTQKNDPGQARNLMELYAYQLEKAKGAEPASHNREFLDNSGYDDARQTWTGY